MMTVRFPTGFCIQYNDAHWVQWAGDQSGFHNLYTKQGGDFIAKVPATAIIEWREPCRMYSAVRDETTETIRALVQSEFKTIQRQIRALGKKVHQ
jgi:hypothetical protein